LFGWGIRNYEAEEEEGYNLRTQKGDDDLLEFGRKFRPLMKLTQKLFALPNLYLLNIKIYSRRG